MTKLPSYKIILFIWVILLLYLVHDFTRKASRNFVQFNYNWDASKVLGNLGKVEIDSISHDFISFKNNFKFQERFSNNNTFLLRNNQETFFRASEIITDGSKIVFSGVKWINQIPNNIDNSGNLEVVDLPLIQPAGKKTITIGDSQIIWREARELRKNLAQKKKLLFVGSQRDAYGYPYEGGTFDTSAEILKKIETAQQASFYILFFGAQDKGVDKQTMNENICEILNLLQNKENTETIFAITLPPSTNDVYNNFNNAFNVRLKQCAALLKKVQIVDFNFFLKDKNNYLSEDEIHLNKKGYLFLNKLLTQEIP